jgi:hypothetical protein
LTQSGARKGDVSDRRVLALTGCSSAQARFRRMCSSQTRFALPDATTAIQPQRSQVTSVVVVRMYRE